MTYRTQVTIIYLLGFFIDLVNMFIANVAYPQIQHQFNVEVSQLAWISNTYILGLTLVIPLSTWLTNVFGMKRILLFSLIIFSLATVFVGFSSSFFQLITWRWVQGVSGGLLIPIGQSITYSLYQNHERAKLSSVVMLIALLAPALSPALGGILVDHLSWNWVFWAIFPLALLTLFLAIFWLKRDENFIRFQRLDIFGLASSSLGLLLIFIGLAFLSEKFTYESIFLLLIGGSIIFWYVKDSMKKETPLLNLHLMKNSFLQISMLIYQFVPGVFAGVNLIAVVYLQTCFAIRAVNIGLLMLPWACASFLAITCTRKLFNIVGPRLLFAVGAFIQGLGILLLAYVNHNNLIIITILAFLFMGFGGSLSSSTAQSTAFINISSKDLADVSALWNINRQLSFCIGIASVSLLLSIIIHVGIPISSAYPFCFFILGCSVVIPIFFCFRILNKDYIFTLEKK